MDMLWKGPWQSLEHLSFNEHDLEGTVLGLYESKPFAIDYEIRCFSCWRTRQATVIPKRGLPIAVVGDGEGNWTCDGEPRPEWQGCLDVDLGFTLATNMLPIKRLDLAVGDDRTIKVIWYRFPQGRFEVVEQNYAHLAPRLYRYTNLATGFTADLSIDDNGMVKDYGELWCQLC
ncbi:putative glycolipid-binding domain-containing protein [Gallaecimonas pentaromativorans]|uniref:Glycolipid-binding protein n=1 Tax=Gallaecimonas pentaromativorans TaxID=584787 RepID=A0A3N1PID5_9GAMM|nr:putative glycolipid-binding domain-containing protein [Gallaecimonas pentaromativorans]MED5525364.1 putative glycolipid-binding domain-containing protein [Pseudomonadota bacterium]ROQ27588.1 hypothetical protein EDC28_104239 [Gallaecimonas pentaromativorans]